MTYLSLLRAARQWLADPDHWQTGGMWSADGGKTSCHIREAASTCAAGAPYKVAYDRTGRVHSTGPEISAVFRALSAVARRMGYTSIPNLNDRGGHGQVLTMYDRAIALAEEMEVAATAEVPRAVEAELALV